jgi:hypothetical protein
MEESDPDVVFTLEPIDDLVMEFENALGEPTTPQDFVPAGFKNPNIRVVQY